MILNILLLIILLYTFYKGYSKGLLHSIFFLLAFAVGIAAALELSYLASYYLQDLLGIGSVLLPVFSFLVMFILAAIAVIFVGKIMEKILKTIKLNIFNRIAGAFVWMFIGIFIFSTFLWYLEKYGFISDIAKEESYAYALAAPVSPYVMSLMGEVLPFLKNVYESIASIIEKTGENHFPEDQL